MKWRKCWKCCRRAPTYRLADQKYVCRPVLVRSPLRQCRCSEHMGRHIICALIHVFLRPFLQSKAAELESRSLRAWWRRSEGSPCAGMAPGPREAAKAGRFRKLKFAGIVQTGSRIFKALPFYWNSNDCGR